MKCPIRGGWKGIVFFAGCRPRPTGDESRAQYAYADISNAIFLIEIVITFVSECKLSRIDFFLFHCVFMFFNVGIVLNDSLMD